MTRIMKIMERAVVAAVVALGVQTTPAARAQVLVPAGPPVVVAQPGLSTYYAAPGYYGTSFGYASFGVPRTYTTFSAFPGPAYGANYPAYGVLPGRYGAGIWRRGLAAPGYIYGAPAYRTFPVGPPVVDVGVGRLAPPPIGVYAPAYGPGFQMGLW